MQLILASESPRRRDILSALGAVFEVRSLPVEELKYSDDPENLPCINARLKANAVAERYPDDLVLGADTIVFHEGRILGKPADAAEAEEMLLSLSGSVHRVITGVSLRSCNHRIDLCWRETTLVSFRPFSRETVRAYMQKVPVLDKAGAYGIQEYGDMLLGSMEGELENVIGLPVKKLQQILKDLKCL